MKRSSAAATLVASLLYSQAALAAKVSSFTSKEGHVVAVLSGEIVAGDADQLTTIIRTANQATKFVSGIRLNSPGGNLAEGVKLADIVRGAKMATVVPNGSTCASACFIVFAAGEEKFVSNNAAVGVHGASEAGAETASSSAATIAMARIVKDLGVPPGVLGKMVVTPPSEVVWLTANDLRAMGTTMTGKPSQLAPSAATVPQQMPSSTGTTMQASVAPTWQSLVGEAVSVSTKQYGGRPNMSRFCQPEYKLCTNAIFFKMENGLDSMLRETEDMNGTLLKKEICTFNSFGDVRKCTDFDTKAVRTDMKDASGKWSEVAGG